MQTKKIYNNILLNERYSMKNIFLTTALTALALMSAPAFAGITVEDTSSPEYLKGHGHSLYVVEIVEQCKANTRGEQYETIDQRKHANDSKPVKWVRKFFTYFDPALDSGEFLNHDIKLTPQVDDL